MSSGDENPQPTTDQLPTQRELEAKFQCATTLLAWSHHRENAQRLAKVHTVVDSILGHKCPAKNLGLKSILPKIGSTACVLKPSESLALLKTTA